MEKLIQLIYEANKSFNTADHLTYVTYPLIKDNRLLIKITENIYSALLKTVEAILYYDRMYKRINALPDDLNARIEIFKTKSAPRYNIDRDYVLLIIDLKNIMEHRKASPMEFIRRDKFIMCDNDYRMRTITIDKVKNYLIKTKLLIEKLNKMFKNDGRL